MSDEVVQPKPSGSSGCLIAAVIAAVLGVVVLGVAALGVVFYLKQRATVEDMVLPPPPSSAPENPGADATGGGDGALEDGEDDGEDDEDAGVYALPVLVKLAGTSEAGEVRYAINRGEYEAVGDAALVATLKKLAVWDEADPDDDLPLLVDIDVATASGITQAQVDAAVKACWSAGAAVLPPPDIRVPEKKQETIK